MSQWFQRDNTRRFYRIDMPIKTFILPQSPIKDRDIYATGANYFPVSIKQNLIHKKVATQTSLTKLKEHKEIINTVFTEVIEFIEFFSNCIEMITEGKSPKQQASYWLNLPNYQRGFATLKELQKSSSKTYQYVKQIEEKYLVFLNSLINSIENSTPTYFRSDPDLPYGFNIDETIEKLSSPKFEKIPLVQAIKSLSEFLDANTHVYRQINQDNYLKQHPKEWKTSQVNISSGGLSTIFEKNFKLHEKVDIYLYFNEEDKALHFEASVVDIRIIDQTERMSFNFEFPDSHYQNFLQFKIEQFEIQECMNTKL